MMTLLLSLYSIAALVFALAFGTLIDPTDTKAQHILFALFCAVLWPLTFAIGLSTSYSKSADKLVRRFENWLGLHQ